MGMIHTAITTIYLFITGGAMYATVAIGGVINAVGEVIHMLQNYVINVFGL
jgi:hypothetical protein